MQKWFFSWCIYTPSQSGGFNVQFANAAVQDFLDIMTPEDVMAAIVATVSAQHENNNVHILALNRV